MFTGKTAIVTGAGRGIGKGIALELAARGANLVLNYRSSLQAVEEVLQEIRGNGGKAIAIQADVSSFDEAARLIAGAKEEFGSIDILVNNAGITKDGPLIRMKESDFDEVIQVNLKGTFHCIRHVSPIMLKQRSGKIINLSSIIGVMGNAGQANYAASKAGIIGLTKACAKELASRGINVNAIAPGFIRTEMTEVLSEQLKEGYLKAIPLRCFGEIKDIAGIAAFLASEDARYITGQVIEVDGGLHM